MSGPRGVKVKPTSEQNETAETEPVAGDDLSIPMWVWTVLGFVLIVAVVIVVIIFGGGKRRQPGGDSTPPVAQSQPAS
jgi:hypothetical protein